jgi:cellulose synthase/poly-beta-1,6-N-acetylglucosamine synthase-like glycosyltransferase
MTVRSLALALALLPVAFGLWAYVGYPLALWLLTRFRAREVRVDDPAVWPVVSFSLPAHNEERNIRATLDSLLALDYPRDRVQIVVGSDASTDRTEEIVREYADRGVELVRLDLRAGKTAVENGLVPYLRGDLVVNTDATIRILPGSLKPLVRAFQDPTVGVASGRDVSVGDEAREANRAESGYVGYEMWVRSLETRKGGIVGASGCFYAIRRDLHESMFPTHLSRDFASAMIAHEHGYRAVSVDEAVCLVPRARSLRDEYRRKIRTMARGLETLWFKRALLNPFRHGDFALMLFSHKLCRWLVHLLLPVGTVALVILGARHGLALALTLVVALGIWIGVMALRWPAGKPMPRLVQVGGYLFAANLAGFQAWIQALTGDQNPIWEPTRRPG